MHMKDLHVPQKWNEQYKIQCIKNSMNSVYEKKQQHKIPIIVGFSFIKREDEALFDFTSWQIHIFDYYNRSAIVYTVSGKIYLDKTNISTIHPSD